MDTSVRLATVHANEQAVECSAQIEAFLSHLTAEQTRFLAGLAEAAGGLDAGSGQLAAVTAIHARLTRQFLDAQRAILKRRAETDARVARIDADAEVEAEAILASALAQSAGLEMPVEDVWAAYHSSTAPRESGTDWPAPKAAFPSPFASVRVTWIPAPPDLRVCGRGPAHSFNYTELEVPGGVRAADPSIRQQIAELGRSVVRTGDEAESLARVIDEAFEADEPDGARAKRQLRALLDEWWRAENQDGEAAIDDANARAAMRTHVAHITGREITTPPRGRLEPGVRTDAGGAAPLLLPPVVVEPAERVTFIAPPPVGANFQTPVLPETVTTALDATDHAGLDAVLASLLDSLQPDTRTIGQVPEVRVDDDSGARSLHPVVVEASQDSFDRFWGHLVKAKSGRPTRDWIFVQVLLPAVAVVAVIAFVLAVVG